MITKSLNRKTIEVEIPSHVIEVSQRVDINVLTQRIIEEKKKKKVKTAILVSSVVASLGILSFLAY
jgi:hypothetical protein